MHEALAHFLTVLLFVTLLAVITRTRKDDRFRCWLVAWLSLMAYFAAENWTPSSADEATLQSALGASFLATGAIFFAHSSMILNERRTAGFRLGLALEIPTLTCIWVASYSHGAMPAVAVVTIRQLLAIFAALRRRPGRVQFSTLVAPFAVVTGCVMLYGAYAHEPGLLISTLLFEMYTVAALDFRLNSWRRTLGTRMIIIGLVGWGATFPLAFWLGKALAAHPINQEIWNLPHYCVAAAIILIVMEEDAISSNKRAEDYRLLFDNHPNALWILDRETKKFHAANQAALEMHGYTLKEFLGLRLPDILAPAQHESSAKELANQTPFSNRCSMHVRKDGSEVPVDLSVHNIDFRGRSCRFVMATDVSEREKLQKRITDLSGNDSLTGLPNRSRALELIRVASEAAVRDSQKVAILSIDMDRFKRVNDSCGMEIGDEYIRIVAARLVNSVRAIDFVVRTGGDEFMVVLNGINGPSAVDAQLAHLRRIFREQVILHGFSLQQTASIGVVLFPDDGTNVATLWQDAEIARINAKQRGGDQVIWASRDLKRQAEEHRMLEEHLRDRIEDGGFHLVYQPIYDMHGKVRSLEALLRLNHPTLGAVGPDRFIPVAESTGLIVQLGNWVIRRVCEQMQNWRAENVVLAPVAINVSGKQLMQFDFAAKLTGMLNQYGLDPNLIHLEVTETLALSDGEEVCRNIEVLAERGFKFSIDDFGTGHSSFARISQFQSSTIKIDRSFMKPSCDTTAHSIVQAIINMSHALGHTVVAEGVETASQAMCLRDLQCDYLQGFLLSRPVAPDLIPGLIKQTNPALADLGFARDLRIVNS